MFDLSKLAKWFLEQVQWLIIGGVLFYGFRYLLKQRIGQIVLIFLLGAFLWFFIRDPHNFFDNLSGAFEMILPWG